VRRWALVPMKLWWGCELLASGHHFTKYASEVVEHLDTELRTGESRILSKVRCGRVALYKRFGSNMQLDVLGLVNDSHPAAAQFLDDAVVRNGLADHASCDPDLSGRWRARQLERA